MYFIIVMEKDHFWEISIIDVCIFHILKCVNSGQGRGVRGGWGALEPWPGNFSGTWARL